MYDRGRNISMTRKEGDRRKGVIGVEAKEGGEEEVNTIIIIIRITTTEGIMCMWELRLLIQIMSVITIMLIQ